MAVCVVNSLDHLVLTVADVPATRRFYERVLGMRAVEFMPGRWALYYGTSKINLHPSGGEFAPYARKPTPGSADLCFLTATPIDDIVAGLAEAGVDVEQGPVAQSGAAGKLRSVYFRDPDGNLVEVANVVS